MVERLNIIQFPEQRPYASPLQSKIDYFDNNWRREGLPQDWFNVYDVGFNIKAETRLLEETGDRQVWAEQVERDLRGFALEYLKKGVVFPIEYAIVDGELVDPRYGNRNMLDTVDSSERGGAVLQSLSEMKQLLIDGKNGIAVVMVSPPGPTGLFLQNEPIVYEDTQAIFLQKIGEGRNGRVIGASLRTDFSLPEARKLIMKLTGQDLPISATVADCVRAIVTINNEGGINSLVNALETVRIQSDSASVNFAYENKTWSDMRHDIGRRQELYEFDDKTKQIIDAFKEYVSLGNHTDSELQKALAVTFLELSKYMLDDQDISVKGQQREEVGLNTYGQVLTRVREIPGCGGGGFKSSVLSIVDRLTSKIGKNREFDFDEAGPCRLCGKDVPCGPCKICETCNDEIDAGSSEQFAA